MDWLRSTYRVAAPVGTILGAILYAWSLFGHIDAILIDHLDGVFATKQDVQTLDHKIDAVLRRMDDQENAHAPSRKR